MLTFEDRSSVSISILKPNSSFLCVRNVGSWINKGFVIQNIYINMFLMVQITQLILPNHRWPNLKDVCDIQQNYINNTRFGKKKDDKRGDPGTRLRLLGCFVRSGENGGKTKGNSAQITITKTLLSGSHFTAIDHSCNPYFINFTHFYLFIFCCFVVLLVK